MHRYIIKIAQKLCDLPVWMNSMLRLVMIEPVQDDPRYKALYVANSYFSRSHYYHVSQKQKFGHVAKF